MTVSGNTVKPVNITFLLLSSFNKGNDPSSTLVLYKEDMRLLLRRSVRCTLLPLFVPHIGICIYIIK